MLVLVFDSNRGEVFNIFAKSAKKKEGSAVERERLGGFTVQLVVAFHSVRVRVTAYKL